MVGFSVNAGSASLVTALRANDALVSGIKKQCVEGATCIGPPQQCVGRATHVRTNGTVGGRSLNERRASAAGSDFGGRTGAKGAMMIEVSAEVVLQMLSGVMNETDSVAEYRLDKPPGRLL